MAKLATLAVLLATSFVVINAANVDAGEVATVIIDAPLYDTRIAADGGCNPAGCSGDLTRVSWDGCTHLVSSVFLDSSVLI